MREIFSLGQGGNGRIVNGQFQVGSIPRSAGETQTKILGYFNIGIHEGSDLIQEVRRKVDEGRHVIDEIKMKAPFLKICKINCLRVMLLQIKP